MQACSDDDIRGGLVSYTLNHVGHVQNHEQLSNTIVRHSGPQESVRLAANHDDQA